MKDKIFSDVANYYASKIAQYGATPQGVDWNSEDSQQSRFEQLCKVLEKPRFSVNDLGCGYGALYDYLDGRHKSFEYWGFDISPEMVRCAKDAHFGRTNARFFVESRPAKPADYCFASGIFNVRLKIADSDWWAHLAATLDILDRSSESGFSFNCLTSYADSHKMKPYLFYADPCTLFDLCKRRYSHNVALLHDYGLYEFTILVRKK